jgi:hypothetical protein
VNFPIKLDDDYPCQGTDAIGGRVTFDDLLFVGMKVGDPVPGDPLNAFPPFGVVVQENDGLWIREEYTCRDLRPFRAAFETEGGR